MKLCFFLVELVLLAVSGGPGWTFLWYGIVDGMKSMVLDNMVF
jgi:hypothetical protein